MAYSRKRTSRKKSPNTRSRGRNSYSSRRKSAPKRASVQTVRIVIENPANAQTGVDQLAGKLTEPTKPRRARF